MESMQAKDAGRQRVFGLSTVMVIALGVSMVIAWLLAADRGGATRSGAEIIEQIRRDGLAAHWRDRKLKQWHLIVAKGNPIGWQAVLRRKLPSGGFEGLSVTFHGLAAAEGKGYWERWKLNARATEGKYRAGAIIHVQGRLLSMADTTIALNDGRVLVRQPRFGRSEAEAPANYIPEGVSELVWYLTAKRGEPGRFRMVFNEMPPSGGRILFGQIFVEKIVRSADGWQVDIRRRSRTGESKETVSFDNSGRIVRRQREGGEVVEQPASLQEVIAAFPQAAAVMRRVLAESGFAPASHEKVLQAGVVSAPPADAAGRANAAGWRQPR